MTIHISLHLLKIVSLFGVGFITGFVVAFLISGFVAANAVGRGLNL